MFFCTVKQNHHGKDGFIALLNHNDTYVVKLQRWEVYYFAGQIHQFITVICSFQVTPVNKQGRVRLPSLFIAIVLFASLPRRTAQKNKPSA